MSHLANPIENKILGVASILVRLIPPESLKAGIVQISESMTLGPLLNPSAWQDGKAFEGSRYAKATLQAVLLLRNLLEEQDQALHAHSLLAGKNVGQVVIPLMQELLTEVLEASSGDEG